MLVLSMHPQRTLPLARRAALALLSVHCACSFQSSGLGSPPAKRDLPATDGAVRRDAPQDAGQNDRATQDRARQDTPRSDTAASDKPLIDKPRADKPRADKPQQQPDKPILSPDKKLVDKKLVDKKLPDKSPQKDKPPLPPPDSRQWPGTPCPCQSPLVCYQNVCRTPCTPNACLQSAVCASSESCVDTLGVGHICRPGVGNGTACDWQGPFCAQGLMCISVGRGTYSCRKLCTPSTSTSSCNCVKVMSMSCYVCV